MSEPMEDKSLERRVEETYKQFKDALDQDIFYSCTTQEGVADCTKTHIIKLIQAERDKQTTLQSQITALQGEVSWYKESCLKYEEFLTEFRSRGENREHPVDVHGCTCPEHKGDNKDCVYHATAIKYPSNHSIPWNCPTYWDGCNCSAYFEKIDTVKAELVQVRQKATRFFDLTEVQDKQIDELHAELAQLKQAVKVAEEGLRVALSHLENRAGCSDCPEFKQIEQALSTIQKCMKGEA